MNGSIWANWFDLGTVALATGAGAGGGFMLIKWFFETVLGRLDKRESRIDKATNELIDALSTQVKTLTERVTTVEKALQECKDEHSKSKAEVLQLRALLEARGEIRQRASEIVAADRLATNMEKENNS